MILMTAYVCPLRKDDSGEHLLLYEVKRPSSLWDWSPEDQSEYYRRRKQRKDANAEDEEQARNDSRYLQKVLDENTEDGFEFVSLSVGRKRSYLDKDKRDAYVKRFRATKAQNDQLPHDHRTVGQNKNAAKPKQVSSSTLVGPTPNITKCTRRRCSAMTATRRQ